MNSHVESARHHKGEFPMTQRLNYTTIAPAGTKSLRGVYGYIAESGLPSSLVNLVYLRVSQINGCARRRAGSRIALDRQNRFVLLTRLAELTLKP
jgi:hypothetical protein